MITALQYDFRDAGLLQRAVVHRSYAHENPRSERFDNETFEFLGDAVLGLAVSHMIFERFPAYDEGELSRLRSSLVNEKILADIAVELGLGECLLLGKGEELTGGRKKASLLADSLEALIAAIYLDGGIEPVKAVVDRLFGRYLCEGRHEHLLKSMDKDYKTQLQELIQSRLRLTPTYVLESEEGPEHLKTFHVAVLVEGKFIARGSGRSKKDAQQKAARCALDVLTGTNNVDSCLE